MFFSNLRKRIGIYIPSLSAIVLLLILGQILSPGFASPSNIGNIMAMATVLAMAAIAQTLIVISGNEGIDLSIGAVMSMGALLGAVFSQGMNENIWYAVLMLTVLGIIIGLINGVAIQYIKIPPLVMTLSMASVVNGFSLAYTKGLPTGSAPEWLVQLGIGHVGPIRWLLILGIVLVLIMELILRKTRYGRTLYLVGSNRRAAILSGINVNLNVILTYVIAGVAGSLGGLIMLGYVGVAQLEMGADYTMLSVAAVVIGGTLLSGGSGTYLGSALGSIVLILLTSVLIAVGMPAGIRVLIQGLILLLILLAYSREPKLRQ